MAESFKQMALPIPLDPPVTNAQFIRMILWLLFDLNPLQMERYKHFIIGILFLFC